MRWPACFPPIALLIALAACGDDGGSAGTEGTESGSASEGTDTTQGTQTSGNTSGNTDGSASNSGTDTTTSSGSDTSGDPTTNSTSDTSGDAGSSGGSSTGETTSLLTASGTYGGDAFSVECDFTDPSQANLLCEGSRWFATCKSDEAVGAIEQFQVWVVVPGADSTAGEKDLLDTQFGITIGDATVMVTPLTPNSPSAVSNTITIDADATAMGPVSGSFAANWGGEGDVSGTFSFTCSG